MPLAPVGDKTPLCFNSYIVPQEETVITEKPPFDSVPFPPKDPVQPKVLDSHTDGLGVVTEIILLHKVYVGRVLGRAGETKRDLQTRSNTR